MEQSTGPDEPLFAGGTSHWLEIAVSAYNEPHRCYHTQKHIQSMLRNLADISLAVPLTQQQFKLLQVAIWFHDLVYIVPSELGRNECLSALRAREFCLDAREAGESGAQDNWEEISAVEYIILCTIQHGLTPEFAFVGEWADTEEIKKLFHRHPDTPPLLVASKLREIFLDLDLAVLAASSSEYDEYAAQIRHEYIHYCWEDYRAGRKSVLKGFLARERLYFTDYFFKLYEVQARQNLHREIDSL